MSLKAIVGSSGSANSLIGAANWSAIITYAKNDIVQKGGILYLSKQAGNLNHIPASSPTWWEATSLSAIDTSILNTFP